MSRKSTANWKPLLLIFLALFFAFHSAAQQRQVTESVIKTRGDLIQVMTQIQGLQKSLDKSHQSCVEDAGKIGALYSKLGDKSKEVGALGGAAGGSGSSRALLSATKQMQEMQMSFNLQYLQLQNSMQNENRQFTMISNIMKTKHDTVKNSINNIR